MKGFDLIKTDRFEMFADLIFPNKCPFCRKVIHWSKYCCDNCYDHAEWINYDAVEICRHCGHDICECGTSDIKYDYCYSAASYTDEGAKNAVLSLKYKRSENAAVIFSKKLYDLMKSENHTDFDYIVPIPMNKKKLRMRGYNQAEILAEHLSKHLNVPIRTDLIGKQYSIKAQHSRNAAERKSAALTEYMALNNKLCSEKILLCDDILTTGSTLNRCAELLKEIGASSVTAAVCTVVI